MAEVELSPNRTRGQFAAILQMRTTVYLRGLRGAESKVVLGLTILFRLAMLVLSLGLAVGAGFAAYAALHDQSWIGLKAIFLTVMGAWQVYVLVRASLTHNVGRLLLRFPLRFWAYVAMWTLSGLTDLATMTGFFVCLGIAFGADFAGAPTVFAVGVPAVFFLFNMALSRAVFVWMEKLLAKRRTREIVLILLSTVGLLPQFLRFVKPVALPHWVMAIFDYAPSTFAASALMHGAWRPLLALLGITTLLAALVLQRLHREYLGEDLHEAATGVPVKASQERVAGKHRGGSSRIPLIVFGNEWLKLKHSGQAAYGLFSPLIFVVLFGVRWSRHSPQWFLPVAVMYLSLNLMQAYNSFGSDGPGFQIYRLAPVSLREVYLGKNLFVLSTFAMQLVALLVMAAFVHALIPYAVVFALLYAVFVAAVHLKLANDSALRIARRADDMQAALKAARGRRGGGNFKTSGWKALVTMFGLPLLGFGVMLLFSWLEMYWLASLVMLVLNALALWWYAVGLRRSDEFNPEHMDMALAALTKA